MSRRVLVTGVATFWGGRVAQGLVADPLFESVIGVDTREPAAELGLGPDRFEFVNTTLGFTALRPLIATTEVDTVVHVDVVVDSTRMGDRELHENNVIGTMNLLAAAGAPDSAVRSVVVKSSTLVYGSTERDPYWFGENHVRSRPATTRIERSLLEIESYAQQFALDNADVHTAVLRFANVLGPGLSTPLSRLLRRPLVPAVAGFDPLLQFVSEADGLRALSFAAERELRGVFNVAGDGRLPWSECVSIAGHRRAPVVPPYLTGPAAAVLSALRLTDLPPELLALLRHGRGVDNRRLRDTGFGYEHTSAGALERFAAAPGGEATAVASPTEPPAADAVVARFLRSVPGVLRPPGR